MKQKILRWSKLASAFTLFLVVLPILVLLFLSSTNIGLNSILWTVHKALPEFSVEQAEGSLLTGFSLKNVHYIDPSIDMALSINSVELTLSMSCLVHSRLCSENLAINGVTLKITDPVNPSSDPEPSAASDDSYFLMPVSINLPFAVVNKVQLDIYGTRLNWRHLALSGQFFGKKLRLSQVNWADAQLDLPSSEPYQVTSEQAITNHINTTGDKTTAQTTDSSADKPIELPKVFIPLDIVLKHFSAENFVINLPTPIEIKTLDFGGTANGTSVKLQLSDAQLPQVGGKADINIQLDKGYPLTTQINAQLKQTALKGQQIKLATSGSIEQMMIDALLTGPLNGQLNGTLNLLAPHLPFELALKQFSGQWPFDSKTADYEYAIKQLTTNGTLESYHYQLKGSIKGQVIPDASVLANGQGSLEQIHWDNLTIKSLGGDINAQGFLDWKDELTWQTSLNFANLQPEIKWPQFPAHLTGEIATKGELKANGGWLVDLPRLIVQGNAYQHPIDIKADLKIKDPNGDFKVQMKVKQATFNQGDNHIDLTGDLNQRWDLALKLNMPTLSQIMPALQGSTNGEIKITGPFDAPIARLDISGKQIDWDSILHINGAEIEGQLALSPKGNSELRVNANAIKVNDIDVKQIEVDYVGSLLKHQLNLTALMDKFQSSLRLAGGLSPTKDWQWNGQLSKGNFAIDGLLWTLKRPTKMDIKPMQSQLTLAANCWESGQASLCFDKEIKVGASGQASVKLNDFSLKTINGFLPKTSTITGLLSLTSDVHWSPDQPPKVKLDLNINEGQWTEELPQKIQIGWNTIHAKIDMANDVLNTNWSFDIKNNGNFFGNLALTKLETEHKQIEGHIKLKEFNIDFLKPLLTEYSNLSSILNTDLRLSGDLMAPDLHGQLVISDIKLAGEITPVEITSGLFVTDFEGKQAKLNASLNLQGSKLKATGTADWQDMANWSFKTKVSSDQFKINLDPMLKLALVPKFDIDVTPKLASIEGNINIPWGRIDVQSLPESAIHVSSDQVILDKNLKPKKSTSGSPIPLKTNLTIKIGNDVKLNAFGLKGLVEGNLKVSQSNDGLFTAGDINIIDGTYRSFGQELIIEQGKILINGAVDKPYLAIKAVRDPTRTQDDVTAGINVTGPIDQPEVKVFSNPTMPQVNALSYLLRGQDIGGDSDGNAIYSALIGLTVSSSGKLVNNIGETLGVKNLQLDSQGSGNDAEVTISGYILPKLQVKYGVGIFDSVGAFTMRYQLIKNFYVEATSSANSTVDLLYQFQFN